MTIYGDAVWQWLYTAVERRQAGGQSQMLASTMPRAQNRTAKGSTVKKDETLWRLYYLSMDLTNWKLQKLVVTGTICDELRKLVVVTRTICDELRKLVVTGTICDELRKLVVTGTILVEIFVVFILAQFKTKILSTLWIVFTSQVTLLWKKRVPPLLEKTYFTFFKPIF